MEGGRKGNGRGKGWNLGEGKGSWGREWILVKGKGP